MFRGGGTKLKCRPNTCFYKKSAEISWSQEPSYIFYIVFDLKEKNIRKYSDLFSQSQDKIEKYFFSEIFEWKN